MPQTPTEKPFYVTTPIYYVNARPHIGHAYTTIVADVVARRHRLLGQPTFFLTGTDEHGQKIERSAAAAGIPPQQFADQVSASFRALWDRMGITYDDFIRTTEPRHAAGVQHLFQQLCDNNAIYKGTYTGQYCVSDEAYVDGPPGIHCPDCGRLTETVSEENFYFRLSQFQLPLLDLIESNSLRIEPDSRRNEVLSFIRGNIAAPLGDQVQSTVAGITHTGPGVSQLPDPLVEASSRPTAANGEIPASAPAQSSGAPFRSQYDIGGNADAPPVTLPRTAAGTPFLPGALKDLSISRTSFSWGIPVPGDEKHVIYVWLDALANYMTALGYGEDPKPLFDQFWPADLHLVGKEIIRFHCVYWPAFLLALNPDWVNPALDPNWANPALDPDRATLALSPNKATLAHSLQPSPLFSSRSATEGSAPPTTQSPGAPSIPQSGMGGGVTSQAAPTPLFGLLTPPVILSDSEGPASPTNPPPLSRPEESEAIRSGETPVFAPAQMPATHPLAFDPAWATRMLPKSVVAHGWLLFEESKMSKSRGNIVRTETILDAFGDQFLRGIQDHNARELKKDPAVQPAPEPTQRERDLFATDVLRYFLLREIPFGQDGSFSFDAMITRYNADLANGYGNLVSRVLKLISDFREGSIPSPQSLSNPSSSPSPADVSPSADPIERTRASLRVTIDTFQPAFETKDFAKALEVITVGIGFTDLMLTQETPWKLAKSPSEQHQARAASVLYFAAESIRILTALLYPILPSATARVWAQLGLGNIEDAACEGKLTNLQWGGLTPGTRLGPLSPIFPRADKGLAQIMADIESSARPASLANIANDERDAATPDTTAFREAPLASVSSGTTDQLAAAEAKSDTTTQSPGAPSIPQSGMGGNENRSTAEPAAGPRTSTLVEAEPILNVAGSVATTTASPAPPTTTHVDAEPSGIFAGATAGTPVSAAPSEASPQITIDDFAKVELRIAQILSAERIPKADKLLLLEVDLGYERRQILSGIAEWYTPAELVGLRIIVIANLAPRKMRGYLSHGMLLAASGPADGPGGGRPILATVPEPTPVGTRLK